MGPRFRGDDGYSIFSPALRITGFQRSASWATKALKASASIGAMIMPSWRMRPWLSGCAMPALIAALTLRTMSGGKAGRTGEPEPVGRLELVAEFLEGRHVGIIRQPLAPGLGEPDHGATLELRRR